MFAADAARLAQAQEHVRRGTEIVAAQRAQIERIRLIELPTAEAEGLLRTFEDTLSIFEDDLRRLEAKTTR